MHKTDKRHEIMKAAERLFTNRRFHEITMADIARAAGVGKGTIYEHFQDKNDLFFQVTTSGFDDLCELLHRRVPEEAPFADQLLDVCLAISRFFESRRQLLRMMQSEGARMLWFKGTMRERWVEKRRKLLGAVAAVIAKGVNEGTMRADIPPEVLAGFLLGMLRTRAHELADAPDEARRLDLLVDLFCTGARRCADAAKTAAPDQPAPAPGTATAEPERV